MESSRSHSFGSSESDYPNAAVSNHHHPQQMLALNKAKVANQADGRAYKDDKEKIEEMRM
mgnify:CR=1 FL=1